MVTHVNASKNAFNTASIQDNTHFIFTIREKLPQYSIVTASVTQEYINNLYQQALINVQKNALVHGFTQGKAPLAYIDQHFKSDIFEHIKELFFIHCVMGFFYRSVHEYKLAHVGDPILLEIDVTPDNHIEFTFKLQSIPYEADDRWKRLEIKAPLRKGYKDLDRQVESFIKEEETAASQKVDCISLGDWVCFDLRLTTNGVDILQDHSDELWIRLSDEEIDQDVQAIFLGKKKGDCFETNSPFLQEYICNKLEMQYTFIIKIKDFVPKSYFSFDAFKRHFSIKSGKDLHLKLIEIFSYRNDLSQRRETVEAVFKTLTKHYSISIPKSLLERKRQLVLATLQDNPDYNVYKAKSDFKDYIKQLAEKQLREAIITDTISHQENMQISHDDIVSYLNILKRPRTKEFLYFETPLKNKGVETPISTEVLKRYCLREKTLNHIIQHLTKK